MYHQRKAGPRVFDYVVSSYTPSLSALLRSLETSNESQESPNLLVVAQPNTPRPGLNPLPSVRGETACLKTLMPGDGHTFLEDDQATVKSTLDGINQHQWVHFACHGSQNPHDPTLSGVELHDKALTLTDLMRTVADNAELAFLSACETAVGDRKIPEESAHLAAGMLAVGFKGVIATMWSIMDNDAPILVEAYYRKLIELRQAPNAVDGQTMAAYALHEAVKVLREHVGEQEIVRWAPFVHFGV